MCNLQYFFCQQSTNALRIYIMRSYYTLSHFLNLYLEMISSFSISDDMIWKWDLRTSYAYVQCTYICTSHTYTNSSVILERVLHTYDGDGQCWMSAYYSLLFGIFLHSTTYCWGKTQTRRLSLVLFTIHNVVELRYN